MREAFEKGLVKRLTEKPTEEKPPGGILDLLFRPHSPSPFADQSGFRYTTRTSEDRFEKPWFMAEDGDEVMGDLVLEKKIALNKSVKRFLLI